MEEMFEIIPWLLGTTAVGAVGGATAGAKYLGPGGAAIGVVAGPIALFSLIGFGTLGLVYTRDLSETYLRKHKFVHCRKQHPGIEKDCDPPYHKVLVYPLKWRWSK